MQVEDQTGCKIVYKVLGLDATVVLTIIAGPSRVLGRLTLQVWNEQGEGMAQPHPGDLPRDPRRDTCRLP